ncbi:hypothetical protein [Streptomyces albipurpureus]|uniref:Uncharacterized protein n=1 Tax=Streptomyces albipurpureus TaxID=2897419 RepID=A0ABT0UN84_9ACTN|nr:hypothetical protein [Streptomyces sp. CWNU-1]MCM2389791.1 hypothetical protein [Streptomyces sp. CWNU-1]
MPKYAKSAQEAEQNLQEYCEEIGFDPEWVTPDKWASSIRIAQDKDHGFEQARKTIDSDKEDMVRAGAKDARKARLAADASGLLDTVKGHYLLKDTLVPTILTQCAAAYVGGERVNLGLGGSPMDPDTYGELRSEWRQASGLAAGGVFTDFVSHAPQNKAALGKGSVGETLAKRKVQGNLLVKIGGVRFNMHIDIA